MEVLTGGDYNIQQRKITGFKCKSAVVGGDP
jgi:hypothetical protein